MDVFFVVCQCIVIALVVWGLGEAWLASPRFYIKARKAWWPAALACDHIAVIGAIYPDYTTVFASYIYGAWTLVLAYSLIEWGMYWGWKLQYGMRVQKIWASKGE